MARNCKLTPAIPDEKTRPPLIRVGYPWWLRPFLLRDVAAITIGRRIWISPRATDVEVLIRHEMVHVEQMSRLGIVRFLWRYAAEYLRNRRHGMTRDEAYRSISFEVEALEAERRDL